MGDILREMGHIRRSDLTMGHIISYIIYNIRLSDLTTTLFDGHRRLIESLDGARGSPACGIPRVYSLVPRMHDPLFTLIAANLVDSIIFAIIF